MTFAEAVSLEILKQVKYLSETLSQGSIKSFDEYKHVCGQIQGLLTANEILKDLAERIDDD
ncbi:MAG: hypothetical protein EBR82_75010 [Caulobacteraceae bacterium]|jgi:hypothetical protein|nr:hypothetical protein [Caulobacteraceae bacterium]